MSPIEEMNIVINMLDAITRYMIINMYPCPRAMVN
jgi:hypothetical protein